MRKFRKYSVGVALMLVITLAIPLQVFAQVQGAAGAGAAAEVRALPPGSPRVR